jgi:hypothetical protein
MEARGVHHTAIILSITSVVNAEDFSRKPTLVDLVVHNIVVVFIDL